MTTPLPPPTAEVARLVALIGPEATLALVEARAAARLYVPRTVQEDGELVRIVGREAAEALAAVAAGEYLKVPVARKWRTLVYKAQGRSYAEIAHALQISQNKVWTILSDYELTASQFDLFDR
ncbi:helix-turn-helix domain-containing protein [Xanthobacter sp. KR7-225]|uniref:helix-turn-helix domain-containing protein n=1 Tax=Xanthobacter sp. KR7-225 TaxID=3156613 RepID=UPI0032B416A7